MGLTRTAGALIFNGWRVARRSSTMCCRFSKDDLMRASTPTRRTACARCAAVTPPISNESGLGLCARTETLPATARQSVEELAHRFGLAPTAAERLRALTALLA